MAEQFTIDDSSETSQNASQTESANTPSNSEDQKEELNFICGFSSDWAITGIRIDEPKPRGQGSYETGAFRNRDERGKVATFKKDILANQIQVVLEALNTAEQNAGDGAESNYQIEEAELSLVAGMNDSLEFQLGIANVGFGGKVDSGIKIKIVRRR